MRIEHDLFRRLCLARDLLREEQERPLTVQEVAQQVVISRFHFIRRFEALFGSTPSQFRTSWRIERARQLLARGESSVTEICMEVGFSSLGSFSTLFKRRVGMPPSAYQRKARTLVQVPGGIPPALVPGCLSLMGQLSPGAFRNFGEA